MLPGKIVFIMLIFDLDGTLLDSNEACLDIIEEMLSDRGIDEPVQRNISPSFLSSGAENILPLMLGRAFRNLKDDVEEFRRRYLTYKTSPESLYSGVAQGLEDLRNSGHSLAICTNKPQALCDKVLHDTDIYRHFTTIVGRRDPFRAKPSPDLLLSVIELSGVNKEQCIMIGDTAADLEAAQACGTKFIGLSYGYGDTNFCAREGAFGSFHDLCQFLQGVK